MKTNMKLKGFTLIELLVVIVIIGILATISVATFSGYFAQARDTERQAAVRNAATIMKAFQATDSPTVPDDIDTEAEFDAILLAEGAYTMPAAQQEYCYYLMTGDTGGTTAGEWAIFVGSEDGTAPFVDGTPAGITAMTVANADLDNTTAGTCETLTIGDYTVVTLAQ